MAALDDLTDEQLQRRAFDAIEREVGPHGLARFLRLQREKLRAEPTDELPIEQVSRSLRARRRRD